MTKTIMFVPLTANINSEAVVAVFNSLLIKENLSAAELKAPDLAKIETLLADNNRDTLLENFIEQQEKLGQHKELLLLGGIPLALPYATELNFAIATALGAAILFVIKNGPSLEDTIKLAKITIAPYQSLYKKILLGCIIDPGSNDLGALEKLASLTKIKLPLIGSFKEKSTRSNQIELKINDLAPIKTLLTKPYSPSLTPPMFKYQLIEHARRAKKKIVLPEGEEPRTLAAANICSRREIAECVLIGTKDKIFAACNQLNIDLDEKITIIEPSLVKEKYITPLYEVRRDKGLTIAEAERQLEDHVVLGTMMLQLNEVDGLVSGATHTTANTIRPAFQIIKTAPGVKLVSSALFMCLPDQVLVYADCAINPNPNAEELADIAIQSALSASRFGITPKVAMLSYSTGSSGYGPTVDRVREATKIVKNLRPDLEIEGPIQYDAAISKETARIKAPNSKVAGQATVFIMPCLDVGNIAYKTVQRSTGITCIGPMLQGLRKPVNDLSRGCLMEDIIFTIAITAIQASS